MPDIILLSEDLFKQLTPVSSNITITSPLKPIILESQLRYIRPLMCKALYDRIQNEIISTVSPAIQTLIDYIRPALAFYTLYTLLPYSWIKMREVGPVNQIGDRTQVIDLEALTYIRNDVIQSAQIHALEITKYLEENKNLYPECNNSCIDDSESKIYKRFFLNIGRK